MTYDLSEKQKIYLEHLLDIQEKNIFNNTSQVLIQEMIKRNNYDEYEGDTLNEINVVYIQWKKTGIIPEYYRF